MTDPERTQEPEPELQPPGELGLPAPAQAEPVPARTRLRSLLEVILCSGFPTQLAVGGLLLGAGLAPFHEDGGFSGRYVFTLSLFDAAVLIGLIFWFIVAGGEQPRAIFLGRRRTRREAVVGAGLVPVVFLLALGILALIQAGAPALRNVPKNPLEALLRSPQDAWIFAAVAVVSGALREELQRAFILHRFRQHLGGGVLGLVLFSLAFGAGHLIQGWDVAITTAALGAFWGALFLVRGSATAAIVSHAGFNVVQIFQYTLFGP